MKNDSFKVYFDKILSSKYSLNKEGIIGYWNNKEKQESFDKKKFVGSIVGLSELLAASSLCFFYPIKDEKLMISVILLGGVGWLTTKVSVTRSNPYDLKEYKEIDRDYAFEKNKYKKLNIDNK